MRQRGTIRGWRDDKGFGFVTPSAGGADAFVHINAFLNRQRRPVDGDEISYEAVQDFQQRWQAQTIRYVDELPREAPSPIAAAWQAAGSTSSRSALPALRAMLLLLILGIVGLVGYQLQRYF